MISSNSVLAHLSVRAMGHGWNVYGEHADDVDGTMPKGKIDIQGWLFSLHSCPEILMTVETTQDERLLVKHRLSGEWLPVPITIWSKGDSAEFAWMNLMLSLYDAFRKA